MGKKDIKTIYEFLKKRGGYAIVSKDALPDVNIIDSFNKRAKKDETGTSGYEIQGNEPQQQDAHKKTDEFYHQNIKNRFKGKEVAVLDIGCADGFQTKDFLNNLADYANIKYAHAIDNSPGMVKNAQKNLEDLAEVLERDMENTGFENESYDIIRIGHSTIGFVKDQDKTFSHFYKLLKPGGVLLIDSIARDEGFTKYESSHIDSDKPAFVVYVGKEVNESETPNIAYHRIYSKKELLNFANKAKFIVDSSTLIYFGKENESQAKHVFVLKKEKN